MKYLRLTVILITVILIAGCRNNKRKSTDSQIDTLSVNLRQVLPPLEEGEIRLIDKTFGELINLKGEPLTTKEIIKPEQLLVKDNYLITYNQRQDSLFMIFKLPDLECVAAFGKKGRGPDEFSFPRIAETFEDSVLFYIYEISNNKVYKVSIKEMAPVYLDNLPKQDDRMMADKQIIFVNQKSAIYAMSAAEGRSIFTYHSDSLPQEKLFDDLKIPGLKGSWTTYIGDFGANLDYRRIVYAYKYFKRLKVIDINNRIRRNIIFDAEELAEGQNDIKNLEPTNITHFWGMSANRDNFWMLYSGRTPVDVMRDNRNGNKYIFVEKYDWNGNPVKRYRLDDWGYFCVTPDNKTLYLASTAGIYSLLRYDLPE